MIENQTIRYAKELGDIFMLVEEIIKIRRQGRPLSDAFDEVTSALLGSDQLDDEWNEDREAFLQTIGFHFGRISAIFLEEQPEAAPEQDDEKDDNEPLEGEQAAEGLVDDPQNKPQGEKVDS